MITTVQVEQFVRLTFGIFCFRDDRPELKFLRFLYVEVLKSAMHSYIACRPYTSFPNDCACEANNRVTKENVTKAVTLINNKWTMDSLLV